ncbi:D-alanyl-D-alanine carboxypeptidase family protein, partial [Peribacillus sp. SIMBA_075]
MTRKKLLAVSDDEIRLDRSAIHYGHLILVNREHPVQLKESSLDLFPIIYIRSFDENVQLFLEKTCLQQLFA